MSVTDALSTRALLAHGIQEWHDTYCIDYDCKCHNREWDEELRITVSAVALAEADDRIATIQDDAVPKTGAYLIEDGKVWEVGVEDVTNTIKYVNRREGWGE